MIKRINKKTIIIFLSLTTVLCCLFAINFFDNKMSKVNAERVIKSTNKSLTYDIDNNLVDTVNNTTTYKVCFDISNKSVNDKVVNFTYCKKIVAVGETTQTFVLPILLVENSNNYTISYESSSSSNIYYTDNNEVINYKFSIENNDYVFNVKLFSYSDNVLTFCFTVPMLSSIQKCIVEYENDKLEINIQDNVIVDKTIHKCYYNALSYCFELSYSYDIDTDIVTIYNSEKRYIWLNDKNDETYYIGNSEILNVSCSDYNINNFGGLGLSIVCYVTDNSTNEGDEGYTEQNGISNCYTFQFCDSYTIEYLPYVIKCYTKTNVDTLSTCQQTFSFFSNETAEQFLSTFVSQSQEYLIDYFNRNQEHSFYNGYCYYDLSGVVYNGIIDNIPQFTMNYSIVVKKADYKINYNFVENGLLSYRTINLEKALISDINENYIKNKVYEDCNISILDFVLDKYTTYKYKNMTFSDNVNNQIVVDFVYTIERTNNKDYDIRVTLKNNLYPDGELFMVLNLFKKEYKLYCMYGIGKTYEDDGVFIRIPMKYFDTTKVNDFTCSGGILYSYEEMCKLTENLFKPYRESKNLVDRLGYVNMFKDKVQDFGKNTDDYMYFYLNGVELVSNVKNYTITTASYEKTEKLFSVTFFRKDTNSLGLVVNKSVEIENLSYNDLMAYTDNKIILEFKLKSKEDMAYVYGGYTYNFVEFEKEKITSFSYKYTAKYEVDSYKGCDGSQVVKPLLLGLCTLSVVGALVVVLKNRKRRK